MPLARPHNDVVAGGRHGVHAPGHSDDRGTRVLRRRTRVPSPDGGVPTPGDHETYDAETSELSVPYIMSSSVRVMRWTHLWRADIQCTEHRTGGNPMVKTQGVAEKGCEVAWYKESINIHGSMQPCTTVYVVCNYCMYTKIVIYNIHGYNLPLDLAI